MPAHVSLIQSMTLRICEVNIYFNIWIDCNNYNWKILLETCYVSVHPPVHCEDPHLETETWHLSNHMLQSKVRNNSYNLRVYYVAHFQHHIYYTGSTR